MEKKYWIEDLTDKQVIHAPTQEIAEKLCEKFDELGFKWCWGDSYLKRHKWEECKEETCYRPLTGNFSSKKWYEENNCEVLTIDQLYDFDEPLKTEEVQIQKKINNNVKNKYWIKDLNENQVIHAPTYEIAQKLCKKFHELGLEWDNGKPYLGLYYWGTYEGQTCYDPKRGVYRSKKWCEENNYEILTIDQLLDFDESFKIEVGKFYKTRDGRKVRIYSTENGGEYPIHGAVESNGIGEVQSWKEGGKYHEEASQSNLDIVEEWIDELEFDVESLPKWRYIAMDSDGRWFISFKKPEKSSTYWYTKNDSFGQYIEEKDCPKNYTGNWEDSIHEIIDGKLIKVKK